MQNEITLDGMDEIQKLFKKIQSNIKDTKPLMAEVGNALFNITMESFENQKSPAGLPWKRLADSTKENKKHPDKILYEEGSLKMSLSLYIDSTTAEIGSNSDYAAIHQFGGEAGLNHSVEMVARPYLPLQDDGDLYPKAWENIEDILEEFWEDINK